MMNHDDADDDVGREFDDADEDAKKNHDDADDDVGREFDDDADDDDGGDDDAAVTNDES